MRADSSGDSPDRADLSRRTLILASAPLVAGPLSPVPRARAVRAPRIISRRQWGANEAWRAKGVYGYAPVRKLIVHHTDGPSWDPIAALHRTYYNHTQRRGFGDIAYHFLIAPDGRIFEGRWARRYGPGDLHNGEDRRGRAVVGAHSLHTNAGSIGVCLIGDYSRRPPRGAALDSLVHVLAWKAQRHDIDPLGSDTYIDLTGRRRRFMNIIGHRGVRATTCPGAAMARLMPWVRREVADRIGRFPSRASDMRRISVIFESKSRLGPRVSVGPRGDHDHIDGPD
jgi:hypothetical protein